MRANFESRHWTRNSRLLLRWSSSAPQARVSRPRRLMSVVSTRPPFGGRLNQRRERAPGECSSNADFPEHPSPQPSPTGGEGVTLPVTRSVRVPNPVPRRVRASRPNFTAFDCQLSSSDLQLSSLNRQLSTVDSRVSTLNLRPSTLNLRPSPPPLKPPPRTLDTERGDFLEERYPRRISSR